MAVGWRSDGVRKAVRGRLVRIVTYCNTLSFPIRTGDFAVWLFKAIMDASERSPSGGAPDFT
jgi:hypothetical protein